MGNPKVCLVPCANGVVSVKDCQLSSSSELINEDSWVKAEMAAAQEIFSRIQPTLVADQKRKNVVEYVQRLITYFTGCEVFPYGSVPLKTYLPNGDIDLTTFCCLDFEDPMVSEVCAILRGQEHNEAAQYKVKDVHCIDAEVKLVKCIVQDLVVDISFNKLGGLNTLCFLEQVDRFIGKEHLFKRSIILVKAWCYYESRILGAHHGLISTFALETLVLYILHKFHSSLKGPLGVLYKLLDYFGTFDWENYCVSLKGPVCKTSLPNIVAELSEDGDDDVLLSEDFLKHCMNRFSISPTEANMRAFPLKHLNIIDPLKETNNLGRSVSRGNFYRIRSAFTYGAEKLGRIILLPRERVSGELRKFFVNCLDRPGSNFQTDIQVTALASSVGEQCSPSSCSETFYEQNSFVESASSLKIPAVKLASIPGYETKRQLPKMISSKVAPELVHELEEGVKHGCMGTKNGFSSCLSVCNHSNAFFLSCHKEQKYKDNGNTEEGNSFQEHDANSNASRSEFLLDDREKHIVVSNLTGSCNGYDNISSIDSSVLNDVTNLFDNFEKEISSISRNFDASNLLELTGDYDIHFKNLQYGQLSHGGYAASLPPSPPLSPQLPSNNPLRTFYRSKKLFHHNDDQSNGSDIALGPRFYPANRFIVPHFTYFGEENKKPRGTGTFFLNPSSDLYNKRPFHQRGRNHAPETQRPFWRHTPRNDITRQEFSASADCRHEFLQAEYQIPSNVDSGSSDHHQSHFSHYATTQQKCQSFAKFSHELWPAEHPVPCNRNSGSSDYQHPYFNTWGSFDANTFTHSFENLELGYSCEKSATLPLDANQSEIGTSYHQGFPSSPGASKVQSTKQVSSDHGRGVIQSYHLKNEDDFPPLSS